MKNNMCEKHLNVKADDYCPVCLYEQNKNLRTAIWDIIGECMSGITDSTKLSQIEKLLLDKVAR